MSEFTRGRGPLIAATIGTMCGGTAVVTYSQSFFVGPVTQATGWSVPQFFLGFTIMACSGVLTGPLIGALVPKFGIRKLAICGIIGHSFGYLLLALNPNSLILWYLSFLLLSFLAAGSLPIIWTSVLNSWFFKHRGLAVGITMSGTGIAAFLLPAVADGLISNFNWRIAYAALAIGIVVISLPVVVWKFKENPEVIAATGSDSTSKRWGKTRAEAMRSTRFWLLCSVLFVTAFSVIGLVSNFKPIFLGKSVDGATIATLGAIMGMAVLFGRLFVGMLIDRFWAPGVAAVFMCLPTMAVALLLFMPFSFTVGVLIAIGIGLAAGAELDLLAFLTSKYFGPKHYAEIFGAVFALFSFGAGLAPVVFGILSSNSGSYTGSLYIALGFFSLAIPLFLALGAYPKEAIAETSSH